jgi:hypothetical protein
MQETDGSIVYIISNLQVEGYEHEADTYVSALWELGVPPNRYVVIREGLETIEQLHCANELAWGNKLVVVSTMLHYPRVRWICWWDGIKAEHHVAWGIPRPAEALRDIAQWILFPLIDVLGLRDPFKTWTRGRRKAGKH